MNKCYDGITEEYEKIFKAQGNGNGPNKPPALSKKQKAQALSKHFHARFSPKGNIETQENAVGMQVYLEARKIVDAIANSLNWYKEMIIFSNAEWLHLSGFAYGGFMMAGHPSGWSTS
ncbi:hypothetical protein CEP51_001508 [Fusarium floridanum]|uniref:Uncharacterized protein n=1 Tax=Fusarium floridanum TaxID=1325733 RepID=A0A428SGS1_9HYPO|nr:hypothetical protein CEP51_001508 [Fusarium floridanum]